MVSGLDVFSPGFCWRKAAEQKLLQDSHKWCLLSVLFCPCLAWSDGWEQVLPTKPPTPEQCENPSFLHLPCKLWRFASWWMKGAHWDQVSMEPSFSLCKKEEKVVSFALETSTCLRATYFTHQQSEMHFQYRTFSFLVVLSACTLSLLSLWIEHSSQLYWELYWAPLPTGG